MSAPMDYSVAIKVTFDKEIVVNPLQIAGTSLVKVGRATFTSFGSAYYASQYHYDYAYDGSTSTGWLTAGAAPQWIGAQFTAPKKIGKFRYMGSTNETSRDARIQGSNNGVDYVDVFNWDMPNDANWHEYTFTAATYTYWRLCAVTKMGTYFRIKELEWYEEVTNYRTTGWDIYATEPAWSPGGSQDVNHYEVDRITWGDTHYEVIAWLKVTDRMKYPLGDITIAFTGTLIGEEASFVAPFTETFTPVNISKIFNPMDAEYVSIDASVASEVFLITYQSARSTHEYVSVDATVSSIVYHIDDIPE